MRYDVVLTKEDVDKLKEIGAKGSLGEAKRAQALILMDKSENTDSHWTMAKTAEFTGLTVSNLQKLRVQFSIYGIKCVLDKKEPNIKKPVEVLSSKPEETLIASQASPDGGNEWELKLMPNGRVELVFNDRPPKKKKK